LDSTFGGLEAMITGLCDEYPRLLGCHREMFVLGLLVFIYLCALPTTTYVLFVCSFALGDSEVSQDLPPWAMVLAWSITASSIICIPLYIIYMFIVTPGTIRERIKNMIKPEEYMPPQLNPNYGTHV
ncbi:hypothetical protein Pcinc_038428, partial [Petrolisthes cinctipes]